MKEQALTNPILGRYTRQALWTLFLMCALPLHAWTMILAFRDLSWLTDRTNAWDAVGVLSYGLLFALAESILLFAVAALLGFITPPRWDARRRIGLMSLLVLVLAVWSMLEQIFFLSEVRLPGWFIAFLVHSGRPFVVLNAVVLLLLGISFLLPAIALLRSQRAAAIVNGAIDRLSLLAMFYLLFDVAALVIVVIRNV